MQVQQRELQPLLLNINEVAQVLRLSRTKVYELIAVAGLPTVRFGKSVRVSVVALQEWIEQKGKAA